MNLRDFDYLVAVAEHLHFGQAAQQCNVSQPTLSMQLRKLEDTLGVRLFERSNKRVMLTPIGADIAARARRLQQEARQIREVAKAAKDPMAGEMRLGVFPTLAPYLLPGLVPLIHQRLPKIDLLLVEEKTPRLIEQLEQGKLDAALLAMPVAHDELVATTLFEEPFLLAVSASHRLASRKRVSQSDLRGESMLLLEDGHCLREQALEVCHTIGMGEAKNFRATSLETLRYMVASGDSVTLIPKLAVRKDDKNLRYIPFSAPVPSRTIGLYARKTSARMTLFDAVAKLVVRDFKKL